MNRDPKILFTTIPLRHKSTHLPVGVLSILSALHRHGRQNAALYDINLLRPPYEEALAHFARQQPDIIGISAVVSTSYQYVKRLSADLRKLLPDVLIVCGGNLAAAAHVLLEKTEVDVCCVGEGERTMCAIADAYSHGRLSSQVLRQIPGIAFLNDAHELEVMPFAEQLPSEEIYDVDWDMAAATPGVTDCFHSDIYDQSLFAKDARYYQPGRRGKVLGRFWTSKGCAARCAFCHRFHKGVRYIPIDVLRARLTDYIKRFNIGFISFSDESFGTHEAWIVPFCEMIKEFDVLWFVGGVRASNVSLRTLRMMYDAGCVGVAFGFETGSADMLTIMRKKVKLEDNYDAVRKMPEANLWYGPQTVIGMPGETQQTIADTIAFLQAAHTSNEFYHAVSTQANYAQALPGTPIYEYARHQGLITPTVDGEQEYLLKISDKNARDADATLNLTRSPHLVWRSWILQMQLSVDHAFIKKYGLPEFNLLHRVHSTPLGTMIRDRDGKTYYGDIKKLTEVSGSYEDVLTAMRGLDRQYRGGEIPGAPQGRHPRSTFHGIPIIWAFHLRGLLPILVGLREIKKSGPLAAARHFIEYFGYLLKTTFLPRRKKPVMSLRAEVEEYKRGLDTGPYAQMAKLRLGR